MELNLETHHVLLLLSLIHVIHNGSFRQIGSIIVSGDKMIDLLVF